MSRKRSIALGTTQPILVPAWDPCSLPFEVKKNVIRLGSRWGRCLILERDSGLTVESLGLDRPDPEEGEFKARMLANWRDARSATPQEVRKWMTQPGRLQTRPGSIRQFLRFVGNEDDILLGAVLAFVGEAPGFPNHVLFAQGGGPWGTSGLLALWPKDKEFDFFLGPRRLGRFFGVVVA